MSDTETDPLVPAADPPDPQPPGSIAITEADEPDPEGRAADPPDVQPPGT